MAIVKYIALLLVVVGIVQTKPYEMEEEDHDDRTAEAPPGGWGSAPHHPEISLSGELSAQGAGWAGESHLEEIHIHGDSSHPADLDLDAGGDSALYQNGNAVQGSSIDSESASSINTLNVGAGAGSHENLAVNAEGLGINVGHSGQASAAGEAASAAAANTNIHH